MPALDTHFDARRILQQSDYWRRSPAAWGGLAGHKEWSYFCVFSDAVTLIVNFSIMDRPAISGLSDTVEEQARIAVLARSGDGVWCGEIEECDPEKVNIPSGGIDARFGRNVLQLVDGVYRLRIIAESAALEADLLLRPVARPALTTSVPLDDAEPMRWLVAPRLEASGEIRHGTVWHTVREAPSYHDHNWGRFAWGGNFSWEWGVILGKGGGSAWSIVYYRIMDRGRHRVVSQGLLLWRNESHFRTFRDYQLTVQSSDFLASRNILCLPGIAAIAAPGQAADIPRRIEICAQSEGESIDVTLEILDRAQIAVPNDLNAGFTLISEAHAEAQVRGSLRSGDFHFESAAIVEFNRAA